MDADLARDILQRDTVEPVLREQIFRRIKDLFHRRGTLFGLSRSAGGFGGLGHPMSIARQAPRSSGEGHSHAR
jgi:hypothetical protein